MKYKKKISLLMASVFLINNLSFVTGTDGTTAVAGISDAIVSDQAILYDESTSSQGLTVDVIDESENEDIDITFKVNNDWGSGFSGEFVITNNTDQSIENWELEFDFTHNIDSLWNGIITEHTDDHYIVANAGYNSTIAAGASLSIGFNGSPGLVNDEPVNYVLTYDGGSFTANTKEADEKDTEAVASVDTSDFENGETYTFNGNTYACIDKPMTWKEAEEYCEILGGHLATITSAEEQKFISEIVLAKPQKGYYWLGGTDENSEGNWEWVTGEEWSYTNWSWGQPDNMSGIENYLHLYTSNKTWNDMVLDGGNVYHKENYGIICEWENPVKHSRYEVFYDGLTWTEAEAYCESLGGHLATVTSEEEYDTILSLIPSNSPKSVFWIGGTSAGNNGVWKWVTDEEWVFDRWASTQPDHADEEYLGFVTTNHGWWADAFEWNNFVNNSSPGEKGFVCEWDDGELFYGKNAFDYALFTGSNEANTILYTNNTTVNGDIHSNSSFYYQGNVLKIDGVCETVGNINAYLSSGSGSYINEKEENTDSIEMFDITDKIKEHIAEISDEDIYFGQNAIEVTDNIGTSQNIQFNGTTFNGKGIVYAGKNISYNVNSLNKDTENKVLLCSDNGNITINGSDISLNGIIYAPNGTVTINANSFMINGRIICDKFVFNGTTLYINAQDDDLDFIKDLLPEKDIAKSPEIQLSVDKTAVKKGENYTVTAKITNNVTPKTFEVYLNDKLYTSEQGEFTLTADTVGQQVIRCVATNKLGEKTQKSIIVNVIENTSGGNSDDYREFWVQLTYNKEEYEKGQDLSVNVVCSNTDDVASAEWFVNGTSTGADISGAKLVEGENKIKLVATSNWGQVAEDEITVTVNTSSSYTICPITLIVTPENGAVLSETVEFRGNVLLSDTREELKYYRLSYKAYPDTNDTDELKGARDNDEGYVTIVEGNTVIDNDILGTWDTTKVPNGRYFVKLYAEDTEGAYSADISNYHVSNKTDSGESGGSENDDEKKTPVLYIKPAATEVSIGDEILIEHYAENPEYINWNTIKFYHNDEFISGGFGKTKFTFGNAGLHVFKLYAEDIEGNKLETSCDIIVKGSGFTYEDGVYITLSSAKAKPGDEITLTVEKSENSTVSDVEVYVDNKKETLKDSKLTITSEKTAVKNIDVKLIYEDGTTKTKTLKCVFSDDEELTPSEVSLNLEGVQIITCPTDISGTVADSEWGVQSYSLAYRKTGSDAGWTTFASGENKVINDVLGRIDPTMLLNGLYDLKLSVTNELGTITSVDTNIIVDGNMKVGNMAIGFTDMNTNVDGVTLTAQRMYDSRNKVSGDFGYGWSLNTNDIKIYETSPVLNTQGKLGFDVQPPNANNRNYHIEPTEPHYIIVDLGNGNIEIYELTIYDGSQSQSLEPPLVISLVLKRIKGNGKLLYKNSTSFNVDVRYTEGPSIAYFLDDENGIGFLDMDNFTYVANSGTRYNINTEYSNNPGLQTITDVHNNKITLSKNGYSSNNKTGVNFVRDELGRITEMTDLYGRTLKYAYNEKGDLVKTTNDAQISTYFEYDDDHNIIEMYVMDENEEHEEYNVKKPVARQIYGEDGRLIATIDASGVETKYEHNIDGREEAITDRRGNTTVFYYNDRGDVIKSVDPNNGVKTYTYDELGNKLTEIDELGRKTTYTYDNYDLTSVTNALNQKIEYKYDSQSRIIGIKDVNGTIIDIAYNSQNNVTNTTAESGLKMDYTYDSKGNATSITDNIGKIVSFTYDEKGNPLTMTDAVGNVATFEYDSRGNCTSKTVTSHENGTAVKVKTQYFYDKLDRLVSVIDGDGNQSFIEYDVLGNQKSLTSTTGLKTEFTYDNRGNVTKISYPDGTSETFGYDAEDNLISAVTVTGKTVKYEYDKLNRLSKKVYPNGAVETYTYDAVGNVTSFKAANGAVTSYTYDALNRNTGVTDALNNTTTYAYNSDGLVESMTDAKGNTYKYEYDVDGNCTKMILPDNSYMQTKYDLRGRITEEIDQTGASTKYVYDNADRLISVIDANESAWTYAYDEQGNITCVTDPNGNKTSYTFDKMNRLVSTTLAEGMSDKTVYDKYGNKVSYTDFNGSTTKYTYDKYYRLSTVTYAEGTTTKYTYATNGLLSQVDFNGQVTKYEYNDLDGLKKKYLPDGTFVEYNNYTDGSLKSVTTNFGTTTYEYDILGRVSKVTDNNKGVTEYSYDAVGNLTKVVNPIKTTTEYSYDNVNRLKSEAVKASNGEVLRNYEYTLDVAGRRTKVVESGKDISDRTVEYAYDNLGRLEKEKVTENGAVSEISYTFDKVSNRLTKTENGNVTAYTYDHNNRLITEGAKTYAYDKNGNTISVTENGVTTTYTYFDFGKIRGIEDDATKESYTYDHEGRRIRKESYTKATEVTESINYLLDDSGLVYNVLAEYDDTLHATTLYTYGTDIISIENNGETSYYIVDGQGSTRALTNAVGLITDTYTYDAFGNITAQTGETYNPYLYNQEQYDANTGLYYLRARYMDPSTGRFVSMDSYGGSIYDPTSLHKYLYANADPIGFSDPSGYYSLSEMSTTISVEAVLRKGFEFIAKAFISYIAGGTIATLDYVYGLDPDDTIDSDDLKAVFKEGGEAGVKSYLIFGGLGAAASVENQVISCIAKKVTFGVLGTFTATGAVGAYDSFHNKRYRQGIFRSILTTASGYETTKAYTVVKNGACFTAGTPVAVKDGYKAIEDIEVGDLVWAENPITGEKELKRVLKTFVRSKDEIIVIHIGNETIETTSEHPFYVEGKGWTAAGKLEVGDTFRLLNGETISVDKIEVVELGGKINVYNFEVEDLHTYFVGENRVLVHNVCDGTGKTKADVLDENVKKGKAFESTKSKDFKIQNPDAEQQITIKTQSGVKTRVDNIATNSSTGEIIINEYKSSDTAPLTKNQKIAFPEIEESGGVVVGKGKGVFTNGYNVPKGTVVNIVRP